LYTIWCKHLNIFWKVSLNKQLDALHFLLIKQKKYNMSVNLSKGQKISLKKEDGTLLSRVFMGLGWDTSTGGFLGFGSGNIDLDASCMMLDENKSVIDTVSFRKLYSTDGSVRHSGDNLTGAGDGDDEVINVDLTIVPLNVKHIVFTVNSYQGQTFDKVKNCFCRLVDTVQNKEIATFKLNETGTNTGLIMTRLYRHNGDWKMDAIGLPCNGRVALDMLTEIKAAIN
jgi:tellurium resistance protein TerZ